MTNIDRPIARVISVCSAKDLNTWMYASKRIVQFIDANEYLIIVPDHEVDIFEKISSPPYKVVPESIYVGGLKDRLKNLLPPENHDRIGWYLQQFIKIAAAKDALPNDNPEAVVLIWDADTIPLRRLDFIDKSGKLIYYQGSEQHPPYFDFIERAFGLKRENQFSFIAQCFPTKLSWAQEFCQQLESSTGVGWIEAILTHLDCTQRAGFSEYESLGTLIWNRHRSEVGFTPNLWERNGQGLLGKPSQLSEDEWLGLSLAYDYISFEAWDSNRGLRSKWRSYKNRLKFRAIGRSNLRSIKNLL